MLIVDLMAFTEPSRNRTLTIPGCRLLASWDISTPPRHPQVFGGMTWLYRVHGTRPADQLDPEISLSICTARSWPSPVGVGGLFMQTLYQIWGVVSWPA